MDQICFHAFYNGDHSICWLRKSTEKQHDRHQKSSIDWKLRPRLGLKVCVHFTTELPQDLISSETGAIADWMDFFWFFYNGFLWMSFLELSRWSDKSSGPRLTDKTLALDDRTQRGTIRTDFGRHHDNKPRWILITRKTLFFSSEKISKTFSYIAISGLWSHKNSVLAGGIHAQWAGEAGKGAIWGWERGIVGALGWERFFFLNIT